MKTKAIQNSLLWRLAIAVSLILSAFVLALVLPERAANPLAGIMILEPLVGLLIFWPLSRVLIRATSLITGMVLSLVPVVVFLLVRLYEPSPNVSFGAMIFFGIAGLTAYVLFRTPPKN